MSPPKEFRRLFLSHNVHAVTMAALSFFGAVVLWNLAYFFFVLILLGLTTAVRGDEGPTIPNWIAASAMGGAGVLLVWGLVDHWANRFVHLKDRPIVGWHVGADFALLPVRLTLAVMGNLGAFLWMGHERIARAWELLIAIAEAKRAPLSSLRLVENDPRELHFLLRALQMTGCIELHAGKQDWFYTVRSSVVEALQRKLAGRGES